MSIFIMLILILLCVCSYTAGYRTGYSECKKKIETELDKIEIVMGETRKFMVGLEQLMKDLYKDNEKI